MFYQPIDAEVILRQLTLLQLFPKNYQRQKRYPAYKKELLGIVYCLRKFHAYVWGRNDLVIVTDHRPLTYILSSPHYHLHYNNGWMC